MAKQIESISKSLQGESIYACSSKIISSIFSLLFTFHLSYHPQYLSTSWHKQIEPRVSCNRERKHTCYSFDRQYSRYSRSSIFSLLLVSIKHVTRMDRVPSSRHYRKKSVYIFFYFGSIFHQLKIVQKGGNRWRNLAYLRDCAQKAIICEITRTRRYICA